MKKIITLNRKAEKSEMAPSMGIEKVNRYVMTICISY